jgi:hypothetical protein
MCKTHRLDLSVAEGEDVHPVLGYDPAGSRHRQLDLQQGHRGLVALGEVGTWFEASKGEGDLHYFAAAAFLYAARPEK